MIQQRYRPEKYNVPILGMIDRSSDIAAARFVIVPMTKISTGFVAYFKVNLINSTASKGDG